MDKLFGKGYLGQSSVVVIAIILVLQVVMPYVAGDNDSSTTIEGLKLRELTDVMEPIKISLHDLKAANKTQAASDIENAEAHRRLTEAFIRMATSVELMAEAVARIDRRGP